MRAAISRRRHWRPHARSAVFKAILPTVLRQRGKAGSRHNALKSDRQYNVLESVVDTVLSASLDKRTQVRVYVCVGGVCVCACVCVRACAHTHACAPTSSPAACTPLMSHPYNVL